MKQKVSIALVLLVALGSLTATASAISFPDVTAGAWYSDSVEYISELGVMVGDGGGNFNPDKPVTRAEMAAIICRTLEKTKSEAEYMPAYLVAENFPDVPESHWANGYINKVSFLGIAGGYGNGRFGPSDHLTYEQAVTMIVRMLGMETKASEYGGYPDGYLAVADSMGLLSGVHAVRGEKFSRANVTMLLFNYLHGGVNENPSAGNNPSADTPSVDLGEPAQSGLLGEDIESISGQDEQPGDSLQIGDPLQEGQPESNPEPIGAGGGS